MSRTIAARYDNGVFVPLEKVVLPDHAVIRLVIPDAQPQGTRRKQLRGVLAGMGVKLDEQDVRDLRAEMWKNFPRDAP